jgi:hypothetical protein
MNQFTKIKNIFLLFLGCLFTTTLSAQCPNNVLTITSPNDAIRFLEEYPDCKDLKNGLSIRRPDNIPLPSVNFGLNALDGLETISGNLSISNLDLSYYDQLFPSITKVDGNVSFYNTIIRDESIFFSSLDTIQGELRLRYLEGEVFNVNPGFILGGLYITNSSSLKRIGFSNNCDQITNVSLLNCDVLEDVSEIDNIAASFESLSIRNCPSLSNCDLDKICELIDNPEASIQLHNNGQGCSYENQIKSECTGIEHSCPVGDIRIESNKDLMEYQDLFGDCDIIDGNLTIINFSDDDSLLTCFDSLKIVTGTLRIYGSNFKSLSFLDNVEEIGSLEIEWCNQLENFAGLGQVSKVNDIKVRYCQKLKSIGDLKLGSESQLQSLELDYCDQLELDDLEFEVKDMDELYIRSATLTSFNIFSSLEDLNNLTLWYIRGLESIEFPINFNAKNIELFGIYDLTEVTTESSNIVNLESLVINSGSTDCSYQAFGGLETVSKTLSLSGFSINSDINLSSLQTVSKLAINGNAQNVLKELVTLDSINYLTLSGGGLVNLEDLPEVVRIDTVNLSNTTDLIDILSLNNVLGLKSLSLWRNSSLESCSIDLICERDADFDLKISGSVPGCRNIEEVELLCNESNNIVIEDIILRSQSDVDSLLIKYSVIDTIFGDIDIYGFNDENEDVITDLSPLENVKYLKGAFTIYQLRSELIESLGDINFHGFGISNRSIPLTLPIFRNVESLGYLLIVETDSIIGDIAFPNLKNSCSEIQIKHVGYSTGVLKIPKLKTLERMIFSYSSIEHVEIDSLENLYFADIIGCKEFKGLKNCQNLQRIIDLNVILSDSLVSVFDTTKNIEINKVVISRNNNITELLGFENISSIVDLQVFDNLSLERISLPNLTTPSSSSYNSNAGLTIGGNPSLSSLDFPLLEDINKLKIYNNNSLQSLSGFPRLTDLTTLTITENQDLKSLDSLNQELTVHIDINVIGNSQMDVCNSPIICNHLSVLKPFEAYDNIIDCEGEIEMILSCGLEPSNCPEGNVRIFDDTDIEYFEQYYNTCKEIQGDLTISGELVTRDIKFDSLNSIKGELIIRNLEEPIKIDFPQLKFLDSYLTVSNNNSNFELMSNNPVIGKGYITRIINNEELTSLSNFHLILDRTANVEVSNNLNLLNLGILSGFSDFERLRIDNNKRLKNLSELNPDGLISIISAEDNDSLTTCDVPIVCTNLETEYLTSMAFNNNADSCTTNQVMNSCLGIVAVSDSDQLGINVFPNPTNSLVNVDYQGEIILLEIYDLSGVLILRKFGEKQIDLSGQKKGAFLLRVKTDKGDRSFKVFKQ